MTMPSLDRLLFRFVYGALSPEMFELELRDALQRLGDAAAELDGHSGTIQLWNGRLLQEQQEAHGAAAQAVNRHAFADAVRHIRRCEHAIASAQMLLAAVGDADSAERLVEEVHACAETPLLRRLPAVASLGQLIEASREATSGGRYVHASKLAESVTSLATALLEEAGVTAVAFSSRLDAVAELCRRTEEFAPATEDQPARDGSLAALRTLNDTGKVLGGRLLTEVEISLAARRRFLTWYERKTIDASDAAAVVAEHSWDGAVDHYQHRSLAGLGSALAAQLTRTASVAEELASNG